MKILAYCILALKNVHESQCSKDHTPNEVTKKVLQNIKAGKELQKANTVEELFKKLILQMRKK